MSSRSRDAWLPYVLMVLFALIEPATHLWISYGAPEGAVPTGAHTGDSSHHLVSMASFANGFTSPFATCQSDSGTSDFGYFAVPIFLLYGLLGEFARLLSIPPFLFLGIANGIGGFLLLWNVYRFFRRIAPPEAKLAFYLYTCCGGLGGMAFLTAWVTGATDSPGFELWFFRFAQYDLIEGQTLAPALLMPRFYYTLPLALGFAALTALVETDLCRCPGHLFFTCFLLFLTACLNLRLGPMFWGLGTLYLLAGSRNDRPYRLLLAGATAIPVVVGSAIFFLVLRQHPSYLENVASVTRMCALLLPLLFATLFHWPAIVATIYHRLGTLPKPWRLLVLFLSAWLTAYALVYAGHQVWYGNWWRGGDISAAIRASDLAVFLALPLLGLGVWRTADAKAETQGSHLDWVVIWFLGLLALSLLAAGGGWFLQFSPQRAMILLGPPLALLTAAGLQRMSRRKAQCLGALILGAGLLSNGVAATWFQGPLGHRPGEGPFAYLHYEYMTEADARLLEELPAGVVIAVPGWSPIAFGEVLALQGEYQVLGGPGAMNLGDQLFGALQTQINQFFDVGTTTEERREFVDRWCVDYVYCPDTCPVDPLVLGQFRAIPWLTPIAIQGSGAVFRVTLSE